MALRLFVAGSFSGEVSIVDTTTEHRLADDHPLRRGDEGDSVCPGPR